MKLAVDIPGKRRRGWNYRKDAVKRDMTEAERGQRNKQGIISYIGDPRRRDKPGTKKNICTMKEKVDVSLNIYCQCIESDTSSKC